MEDNKKYWLNELGLRYWTNKNDKYLTAMRSYHWVDRVTFIDESEGSRTHVGETTFTKFIENEEHWYPMSKKQYEKKINDLKENNKNQR